MEEEGYEVGENEILSPLWSKVRRVVTSPWFQIGMSVLVILYLVTTVFEILTASLKIEQDEDPRLDIVSNSLGGFNCGILFFFLSETMLRAFLHKGGWLSYLSNPWSVLDLVVILASAIFEALNYLRYIDCSEAAAIIAVVRISSSLRTINTLNSLAINNHVAMNRGLGTTLRHLARECNEREKGNKRLSKEISVKLRGTKRAEVEMSDIRKDILVVQKQVWHQIVPTPLILGLTSKSIKARMPRSKSQALN